MKFVAKKGSSRIEHSCTMYTARCPDNQPIQTVIKNVHQRYRTITVWYVLTADAYVLPLENYNLYGLVTSLEGRSV